MAYNSQSNQKNPSQPDQTGEMVEAVAKAAFICGVAFCILAIATHALMAFTFGYLYFFAWKEDRGRGVFTVALCHLALTHFVAGPPMALIPYDEKALWNGLLLEDFGRKLQEGYIHLCQFFHQRPTNAGFWKWVGLANLGFYLTPVLAAATAFFYFPKKEFQPRGYRWLKAAGARIQWVNLYLPFRLSQGGRALGILFCLMQSVFLSALLYRFRYAWPDFTWAFHLGIFSLGLLACFGVIEIFSAPSSDEITQRAQGRIELGRDGTPLTLEQINHHVHILGGSGFGKSVLLSHVIRHHIEQGMGMVFLDLKADKETVLEIVSRCEKRGRMKDLRLFHCGRPEISCRL